MIERVYLFWTFIEFDYLKNIVYFFSFFLEPLKAQPSSVDVITSSIERLKKKKKERIKSTNMGEIKFIHFARLCWEEHRKIDKNKSRGIFMEVISGKEESNDVYV